MIFVNKPAIVYIACLANFASGGPELLHQLAFELKQLAINVKMLYLGYDAQKYATPVHENYLRYELSFCFQAEDDVENILILPEISLDLLKGFEHLTRVIWWLSIDNAWVQFDLVSLLYDRKKIMRRIFCKLIILARQFPYFSQLYQDFPKFYLKKVLQRAGNQSLFHLAQSEYAMEYLASLGIQKVEYLSDYLRDEYMSKAKPSQSSKQDIVAYNPKKGMEFTQQIIQQAGSIKFVAIENLSIDEVAKLLMQAKVYIDFGSHPGKDRIPREAAIMNCCVISGRRGSANFYADLKIANKYKFNDELEQIPAIIEQINYCLANYPQALQDFEDYRQTIWQEADNFRLRLRQIFKGHAKC